MEQEPEAILRTIAMMAYNPSIGRVLQRGGVSKFADLMVATVPKFYGLLTRERFDAIHAETCDAILSSFKTARGGLLSYGQAQKAVNVFLKVYVDWAKQPTREVAAQITPLLHVPLDSLLMSFVKREFPEEYAQRIGRARQHQLKRAAERLNVPNPRSIARALFASEFALASLTKEMYLCWQEVLRELYPAKPVLLDVIWVMERGQLRAAPQLGSDIEAN